MARVYKKGQVTIPKAVRDAARIDVGDRIVVEARDHEIIVRRPRGVLEFDAPAPRRPDTRAWSQVRQAARADRLNNGDLRRLGHHESP